MRKLPPCRILLWAVAAILSALCLPPISANPQPKATADWVVPLFLTNWRPPVLPLPTGFTPMLLAQQTGPQLVCTPNLAFGTVTVGARKTMVISCTNTGTVDVVVGNVSVFGQGFSLEAQSPVQPTSLQILTAQKGVRK